MGLNENFFCREIQGRLVPRVMDGNAGGWVLRRRGSFTLGMITTLMETFLTSKTPITNPENLLLLLQDTIFLRPDESSPPLTWLNMFFSLKPCVLVLIFLWLHNFSFMMLISKLAFSLRNSMRMSSFTISCPLKAGQPPSLLMLCTSTSLP